MDINHIGIILDGNRRFARQKSQKPWKGHEEGAKNVERIISWCMELGIRELTMFCFSTENFKRAKEEVGHLMKLFMLWFNKLSRDKSLKKKGIKINFIGRLDMLPKDVRAAAEKLMNSTIGNGKMTVNFALAYGSRMEITEAAKEIALECLNGKFSPEEIDEDLLEEHLMLKSNPDLIIRPGGEQRLSNFLLWQSAYSELYFTNKLWPEFTKDELVKAIKSVKARERRFGK